MKTKPVKKVLILINLVCILLTVSTLTSNGQSLTLKNATIQESISKITSSITTNTVFTVFKVKGKTETIKLDSLCFARDCFFFLTADTTRIKYRFVRGKKSNLLEINITTDKSLIHPELTAGAMNTSEIIDWLYYHSGNKAKKVAIQSVHQLPAKTE